MTKSTVVVGNTLHSTYDRPQHTETLGLRRTWQKWLVGFKSIDEPRIWQTIDDSENVWWHVYDPVTGRSATRESTIELLAWIDAH